jgi:hypothetical protein
MCHKFIDIKPLTRLKDMEIGGSFTINCENKEQLIMIQDFFKTKNLSIAFNKIAIVKDKEYEKGKSSPLKTQKYKFVIKYNTIEELLKLRDIFEIRANKFDMSLNKKRNKKIVFNDDLLEMFLSLDISKVRK